MYLVKTPPLIKTIFNDFLWEVETQENEVFLTFDDGPIPEVTPWVLDQLNTYGFKATFFCVGENVVRYPDIYQRIIDEGHTVGNHTYNHLNGWLTDNETYLDNIKKCDPIFETHFFRPPYGKIKKAQLSVLRLMKSVVMWDILSGDFDQEITKEKCLSNVINQYKPGSIIVFHDSIKAQEKLTYVLPRVLKHLADNGFCSESLDYAMAQSEMV
ncbi:MAG: polysaccharide deacetylase family protein [Chitinophagales bacterium]|nr:polysaccharide deacetylase family protein [Chitinophagales bacterium]